MIPLVDTYKTDFREPHQFSSRELLQSLAFESIEQEASDIYLTSDRQVSIGVHGRLRSLTERRISTEEILQLINWATGNNGESSSIAQGKEVVGSYSFADRNARDARGEFVRKRFRVNATRIEYRGTLGVQLVMRIIPSELPRIETLGLDPALLEAMTPKDGIIYITGATGSGKSTTFAGVNRYILEGDTAIKGNINIYESPIEFIYDTIESDHSILTQSEVPRDIGSFALGIRTSMRRSPKLIVIGETRDWDTASASIEASTTGHPVFTTLHTTNVKSIPSRLMSLAPTEEQSKALYDILSSSRVWINQVLAPSVDGRRTPLREYLIVTDDLRDVLLKTPADRVTSVVGAMVNDCGVSMATAAMQALERGLISEAVARTYQPKLSVRS